MPPTNPSDEDLKAFVGRCKCGGVVFAAVDKPEYRKDNAEAVADLIANGFTIEHIPIALARESKWCTKSKEHMRG
jgi:hypothetical protein